VLRAGSPQWCGDSFAEFEYALVETGTAVVEVDEEAVAPGLDVLHEPLERPLGWAGDYVAATLVAARLRLRPKRYADAQHDAAVRPSPAQLGGQRAELVGRERDRVPDARAGGPSQRRRRDPGHPQLGPAEANQRRLGLLGSSGASGAGG